MKDGRARPVLNGLQLIQAPIYGGLAQSLNHGDELKWLVFHADMWKANQRTHRVARRWPWVCRDHEAWFADSPPPAERGEKVRPPELPASDKPEVKVLIEKIKAL
ncbi:MAG: hypothetical protein U0792_11250 [Gemmataceae bacterium]